MVKYYKQKKPLKESIRGRYKTRKFAESDHDLVYDSYFLDTIYGMVEPLQTVLSMSDIYNRFGDWEIQDFFGNLLGLPTETIDDYFISYDSSVNYEDEVVDQCNVAALKQFLLDQGLISRG